VVVTGLLAGAGPVSAATPAAAATAAVTVSVSVTASDTGQPVANVCGELNSSTSVHQGMGGTCAGADGVLTWTSVPAGTWYVHAFDGTGVYVAGRTPDFVVTDGGADVTTALALARGGVITGKAVDRITRQPIPEVCPTAFAGRTDAAIGWDTCTGPDGVWTITALPAGTATVRLSGDGAPDGHSDHWARDADTQSAATLYTVASGGTIAAGTVPMDHGATVRGRIADRSGSPVSGAEVVVDGYDANGGSRWNAITDDAGQYEITQVSAGRHIVLVTAPNQPYAWQWSGRAIDQARASALSFRNNGVVRFDAALAPAAPLTVTVNDAKRRLVDSLRAYAPSGAPVGFEALASPGVPVSLLGLPASTVRVRAHLVDGTVAWYPDATSFDAATPVQVSPGQATEITVVAP
jgi:Carboxypeptidase regulatory-like domain